MLFSEIPSAADVQSLDEGQDVKINCQPSMEKATIVFWFRVVNNSRMELIGSFAPGGQIKIRGPNYENNLLVTKSGTAFLLTLKSFNKRKDSGTYTCASLVKGNELSFGLVTVLQGKFHLIISIKPTPNNFFVYGVSILKFCSSFRKKI